MADLGEDFAFFCWLRLTGEPWYTIRHPKWWWCGPCGRWHASVAEANLDAGLSVSIGSPHE